MSASRSGSWKIAAVVIWYEPKAEYLKNLSTYAPWVGHTYIVDNSSMDHSSWVSSYPGVTYVWLGGNFGIARALNVGVRLAENAGYQLVLTMDQDSWFEVRAIERHLTESVLKFSDCKLAIVGATFSNGTASCSCGVEESESVITSGNLLRLSAWRTVNGFDDKLFIDQVDHDFCRRLRRHGYRIVVNKSVVLEHSVGKPLSRKILGYRIRSTNHAWVRRYYQVRNSLYLRRKYPDEAKPLRLYLRDVWDHCLGILLLEDQVALKYKAMLLGAWDFFRHRFGSWDDHHGSGRGSQR
jgi:rhamnosyltransferase